MATNKTYEDEYEIDDGCIIFVDTRTSTRFYKCRLRLDGGKYIYRSMRTRIQKKAILNAYQFLKEIRKREMLDLPIKDYSVKEIFDIYLNDKAAVMGENNIQKHKRYVDLYFSKYFGDQTAVSINQTQLAGYYEWRRDYWKHNDARKMNERHRHIAKQPADSTIFNEVVHFNSVMLHAMRTGKLGKRIRIPTDDSLQGGMYKRPSQATFSDKEIRKINYHLRNSYLRSVPKMINANSRRGAINLYCAFFILAATGMRTMELYNLRYRDIEEEEFEYEAHDGTVAKRQVYVLRIEERKAKRKKFMYRYVIASSRFGHFIKRAYENNAPYNKPEDFVLNRNGKKITTLYAPFKKILEKLDLRVDKTSGYTRDLRHIRAWYISDLIARNIPIATAATQAGTSIAVMQSWYLKFSTAKQAKSILRGSYVPSEVISLQEMMNTTVFEPQ